MTMMELLACAGMIAGFFFLLNLKLVEFTDQLFSFLLHFTSCMCAFFFSVVISHL